MTTLAVTGHTDLTGESVPLVREALRALLAGHTAAELVGVPCIAAGADALFAAVVVEVGGPAGRRRVAGGGRPGRRVRDHVSGGASGGAVGAPGR